MTEWVPSIFPSKKKKKNEKAKIKVLKKQKTVKGFYLFGGDSF